MKRYLFFILILICTYASAQVKVTSYFREDKGNLEVRFHVERDYGWHLSTMMLRTEELTGLTPIGELQASADTTELKQVYSIKGEAFSIKGYLSYIACNDEECNAPVNVEFDFSGSKSGNVDGKQTPEVAEGDKAEGSDSVAIAESKRTVLDIENDSLWCPVTGTSGGATLSQGSSGEQNRDLMPILNTFLICFIGGLLSLFTPCIWPIIPLTVSFFLKRGNGRKDALTYGTMIVCQFCFVGVYFTMMFGPDAMNYMATSALFNILCFIALLVFGLSFFGLFELQLPSGIANKINEKADKSVGIVSIFFMALTLVVVGFSCTAPILGTLLVEIATESSEGVFLAGLRPVVGMFGFSLALAMPFTLFAYFPQLMKRMPRSGSWMTHVKVVLGVLEVAFSLKFFSVADQAYGWDILSRTMFMWIWAGLAFGLATYLWIKVKGTRGIISSALPLLFGSYLIFAALGKNSGEMVSAFAPIEKQEASMVFNDYEEGMEHARKVGKPVFLEFTGYGCVNCRKMEMAVFSQPRVQKKLEENFVIIRLYVDDRKEYPTPLVAKVNGKARTLYNIGDKWSLLESYKFGSVAQPFYIILDGYGNALSKSYSYNEDVDAFLHFLDYMNNK